MLKSCCFLRDSAPRTSVRPVRRRLSCQCSATTACRSALDWLAGWLAASCMAAAVPPPPACSSSRSIVFICFYPSNVCLRWPFGEGCAIATRRVRRRIAEVLTEVQLGQDIDDIMYNRRLTHFGPNGPAHSGSLILCLTSMVPDQRKRIRSAWLDR